MDKAEKGNKRPPHLNHNKRQKRARRMQDTLNHKEDEGQKLYILLMWTHDKKRGPVSMTP
jgi:hypothetical protein